MQFQSTFAMATLALVATVKADFQIYKVEGLDVLGAEWDSWMVFDGPPSCNDVNHNYRSLSSSADVSSVPGVRCKGCDDDDILELEINSGSSWGHYTIYKDRGYVLEPAGGGSTAGSCTPNTGHEFVCAGAVSSFGTRAFICDSDKGGIRAR